MLPPPLVLLSDTSSSPKSERSSSLTSVREMQLAVLVLTSLACRCASCSWQKDHDLSLCRHRVPLQRALPYFLRWDRAWVGMSFWTSDSDLIFSDECLLLFVLGDLCRVLGKQLQEIVDNGVLRAGEALSLKNMIFFCLWIVMSFGHLTDLVRFLLRCFLEIFGEEGERAGELGTSWGDCSLFLPFGHFVAFLILIWDVRNSEVPVSFFWSSVDSGKGFFHEGVVTPDHNSTHSSEFWWHQFAYWHFFIIRAWLLH